jgi:ribonuclease R
MSKKKKQKKTKENSLNHRILEVFRKDPTQNFNYKQVSKKLDVKETSKRKLISKILYELFDKGQLIEEKPGSFKLEPSTSNLQTMVGKVDMTQTGTAYIEVEGLPDDIFISENNLGNSLHGDLVEISIIKVKRSGKPIGKVEKVIERAMTEFVGVIEKSLKYAFLVPDSKRMPVDIFIPLNKLNGAENGEKAIAKMMDWPADADSPFGEIIQVLGKPGENETEMHAILAEYGLPSNFPKHIVEEAEKIDTEIKASEVKKRRDMRQITTFTIDPVDAKDFDDALSVQKLKNGNWEIGVHIADVSHYLKEDSLLDQEAFERATSVYLVDRVVPMLPEVLSNFACSLRPNEDKYCFSAVFELDDNTKIVNEWFGRTVINSDRRFAYEEAQKVIESGKGDYADEILTLDRLAKQMRKDRFRKGAIDFHTLEVKFELDEKGEPLGVFVKEQKDANKLIEEFMLLANKQVATFIGSKQQKKPFVYRIHANPDPEKLQTFSEFIKKFGYRIDTTSPKGITSSINRLMSDITGKSEEQLISQLAIRTMAKAEYSTENIGHYGLGFHYYSHFTSPIRRYPDVMVHRLLQHYLDEGKAVNQEELEQKCKHSSEREKLATDAERASIKFMQVKFMQGKEGEVFGGVVSGVSDFGLFVELKESKCEGLIRLKSLTDDYYTFNPDNFALEGKRTGKVYRIGDELTVKVMKADLAKKQLDFELMSDINV